MQKIRPTLNKMIALLLAAAPHNMVYLVDAAGNTATNAFCLPGYARTVQNDVVSCTIIDKPSLMVIRRGVCIFTDYNETDGGSCMEKCAGTWEIDANSIVATSDPYILYNSTSKKLCQVCFDSVPALGGVSCLQDVTYVTDCDYYSPTKKACAQCKADKYLRMDSAGVLRCETISSSMDFITKAHCVQLADGSDIECAKCDIEYLLREAKCLWAQHMGCAVTDGVNCVECLSGFSKLEIGADANKLLTCQYQTCAADEFDDEAELYGGGCQKCDTGSHCTCQKSPSMCVSCLKGYYNDQFAGNGSQNFNETLGKYEVTCAECIADCVDCLAVNQVQLAGTYAAQSICSRCAADKYLVRSVDDVTKTITQQCVAFSVALPGCEPTTPAAPTHGVDGDGYAYCRQCQTGYFLYKGQCYKIDGCDAKSYYVDETKTTVIEAIQCLGYIQSAVCKTAGAIDPASHVIGECQACQTGCKPGHCDYTEVGRVYTHICTPDCADEASYGGNGLDTVCLNNVQCEDGYYYGTNQQTCYIEFTNCDEHEEIVTSAEGESTVTYNGYRCKKCATHYFWDTALKQCVECSANCEQCTSKAICTKPEFGYYLIHSNSGTLEPCGDGVCEAVKCDASCITCEEKPTTGVSESFGKQCLICAKDYAKVRLYGQDLADESVLGECHAAASACGQSITACSTCNALGSTAFCKACGVGSFYHKGVCITIDGCQNNYKVVADAVTCECPRGTYLGKKTTTTGDKTVVTPACVGCPEGYRACHGYDDATKETVNNVAVWVQFESDPYECEDDFVYENTTTPKKCLREPNNCDYKLSDDQNALECTKCYLGFGWNDATMKTCSRCPLSNCKTCNFDGTSQICTACFAAFEGLPKEAPSFTSCALICAENTEYRDGTICRPCPPAMVGCEKNAVSGKVEATACVPGYYKDVNKVCVRCARGYMNCTAADKCDATDSNVADASVQCLAPCQPGYYHDAGDTNACKACQQGCVKCSKDNACNVLSANNDSCMPGFEYLAQHPQLEDGVASCFKICPTGDGKFYYHPEGKNHFCTECPTSIVGCNQCATATTCAAQKCQTGYEFIEGTSEAQGTCKPLKMPVGPRSLARQQSGETAVMSPTVVVCIVAAVAVALAAAIGIAVAALRRTSRTQTAEQ